LDDIATDLKTDKIRDNFTPSLGKDHGRALLRAKKPLFEQRLTELRTKLKKFQAKIKEDLQSTLMRPEKRSSNTTFLASSNILQIRCQANS
jgi:predicted metal-dependent peptidase